MTKVIRIFGIVFAIVLCVSQQAQAQSYVELETETPHLRHGLGIRANLSEEINSRWSANAFCLLTGTWGECYAGPTWRMNSNFALNLSVGGQQSIEGFVPRYAMSIAMTHGHWLFLGIGEASNDAFHGDTTEVWYDITTLYEPSHYLAIGARIRDHAGAGPLVEGGLHNDKVWIHWGVLDPAHLHTEASRFSFGIKHIF